MEVTLTKKEVEILEGIKQEYAQLQNQINNVLATLRAKEASISAVIFDHHGITPVEGIKYEDGKFIIPDKPEKKQKK